MPGATSIASPGPGAAENGWSRTAGSGAVMALWYRVAPIPPPAHMPSASARNMGRAKPRGADEPAATAQFTISDLAREFAVTTRAIRFYEAEGLLAPIRQGRSRLYTERERVRVKLILRGKRLGLSLSEIRELFDLYTTASDERPQLVKF